MPTQAPKELPGARADAAATDTSAELGQATRLHQMRDRLASLSDEAYSIRSQVPTQFKPDVERIQKQMQRLGERLAELSGGAISNPGQAGTAEGAAAQSAGPAREAQTRRADLETDPEKVIVLGAPRKAEDPWDEESANALTRFYESGEAYFGTEPQSEQTEEPQSAMQTPESAAKMLQASGERAQAPGSGAGGASEPQANARGVVAVESAWLDERFGEIARRIEQSLAQIRPESSLLRLGQRFDQLEARMSSVLGGVATRADVEQLRIAEKQIDDISAQLEQLRRQLARLDAIDAHLGALTAQLSDERFTRLLNQGAGVDAGRIAAIDAQLGTIAEQLSHERLSGLISESAGRGLDIEGVAAAAARRTASEMSDSGAREIGEVRGLIENLINERRHSDENNASMLETMQQAIIRVLDRIDALELGRQYGGEAASPMPPMGQPQPEPAQPAAADFEPAQAEAENAYEAPPTHMFAAEREEPQDAQPEAPFAAMPFDLDAAFARESDAGQMARPGAAPNGMDTLRHDFIADAQRAKLKAASKLEGSPELGQERSSDNAPSSDKTVAAPAKPRARRSIFNIRSPRVLLAILILLAMIPAALFFMPRAPADGAAVPAKSMLPLFDEGASGSSGAGVSPRAPGAQDGDGAGAPSEETPSKQTQQLDHEPQDDGKYQDAGNPGAGPSYEPVETAALPSRIALGSGAAATARHLAQRPQQERIAFLQGRPGLQGAQPTPAALMQEQVLRRNGAPVGQSEALALPPAMVGPFSLRLAAAQGDASAQFEVASRLAEGKGAAQDLKQAVQWYRRAADNGFAMAQFRLGTLFERGVGVKANTTRAQVWYARAAEQGNVKAMHNLAVLIASGRGSTKPDYPTAAKWFAEAAKRGLSDSQYNLAVLYENGLGVGKDAKEAYKWLLLAAQSGDAESKSRRDALKATLSAEDRAAVEAHVRNWRPRPTDPLANDFRAAGQAWRRQPQRTARG